MDWFGAGINGPLVAIRSIHFAATTVVAGSLIFRAVVVEPALRSAHLATPVVRSHTLRIVWTALAISVATGVVWLMLQAASMSGLPLGEAVSMDVLSTVVNETQFGLVSKIRFVLAIILAVCLAYDQLALPRWLALGSALGFTAAIAWTGHAGSTPGEMGNLHLTADAMHLVAAASWIGGLVPLAVLLAVALRQQGVVWASLGRDAAVRFSTLGILSVGTLLATGIVNAWILVGSFHALAITEYGRLLMLKIAVFAIMLLLAAANRFWLTPQLAYSSEKATPCEALRQLTRNSVIEIALGFTIFAIVGILGTMHPAIHLL